MMPRHAPESAGRRWAADVETARSVATRVMDHPGTPEHVRAGTVRVYAWLSRAGVFLNRPAAS